MKTGSFRVALRADASAALGLGHVKRCLALGQALMGAGAHVCLLAHDQGVDTASLAGAASIGHMSLGSASQASEAADANLTTAALLGWQADLIVVDSYALGARWHRAVREGTGARIAAIDDLGDRDLAVDWLIDHNHAANFEAKYAGRLPPGARRLCGPRHALLAPVYAGAARHAFRPHVESIGIFMGGADSPGVSLDAVRACREVAHFKLVIEVATTSANPHLDKLRALCKRWPGTTLSVDSPDLASFFARHDLQIGAGGGATWERCCIGAPTLALVCADNQRDVITALAQTNAIATLRHGEAVSVDAIGQSVAALLEDPERRRAMALRSRQLVDGLGARRVALSLCASTLAVRPATAADAALTYAWRNHPSIRGMSHDGQEITWPAHERWMNGVLSDPTRRLLLAGIGDVPVGVIRFDRQGDSSATVSLYIDPDLHGLGLGGSMLLAGERHVCRAFDPPTRFEATILETNAGSQRMFRSAGYRPSGDRWIKNTSPLAPEKH